MAWVGGVETRSAGIRDLIAGARNQRRGRIQPFVAEQYSHSKRRIIL
jgi:hypothetical protein